MLFAAPSHASDAAVATQAFDDLSSLLGSWEGTFSNGRKHHVTYRLTAGGSVLVETWALGPQRESLTMYHRDGDALVATHYCPQGNQPRLQLARRDDDGTLRFDFRDGTNLQVPDGYHQHEFWLKIDGADAFTRSEAYVPNVKSDEASAEEKPEIVHYVRIAPAPSKPAE
jgi:hypothetical protein